MKKYVDAVVTLVLTFLVMLALNTASNYLSQSRARITDGVVTIGAQTYDLLDIENFGNQSIDGLRVDLPRPTEVSSVTSAPSIDVKSIVGLRTGPTTTLVLSGIDPRRMTRVLIPIQATTDVSSLTVSNASEHGTDLRSAGQVESRLNIALESAFFGALIYSIFFAIASFWSDARWEKAILQNKTNSDELRKQVTDLQNSTKEFERKADRAVLRMRLNLVSRLSDYAKELSFWREVAKELILQSGGTKKSADDLISAVTRRLETWGTNQSFFDRDNWNAIQTAAALVAKPDEPVDLL